MKILLSFLMVCAAPVWAQKAPEYDFFKAPEGTVYLWETESGPATGTIGQQKDGLRAVLIRQDAENSQVQTIYVNSFGQVKHLTMGPFSMSFDPHDCSRKSGDCSFAVTPPHGETFGMRTRASFENGIWLYLNQVDSAGYAFLIEKECKIYDAHGVVLASAAITFDGAFEWQRRLSQGYEQSSHALLRQAREACGFAAFEGV